MATLTTSTISPTKRKKLEVIPVVTSGILTPLRTRAEVEAHDETSMHALKIVAFSANSSLVEVYVCAVPVKQTGKALA